MRSMRSMRSKERSMRSTGSMRSMRLAQCFPKFLVTITKWAVPLNTPLLKNKGKESNPCQ